MKYYLIKVETLKAIAEKLRNIKNSDDLILVGNFASEVEGIGNTLKGLIEGSAVDLIIPYGVTKINTYAFTGFTSLKSVMIPDTVTTIGNTAFSWCQALESIKIPKSVSYIDSYAFTNCTNCLIYDFSEHDSPPTLPNDTIFNAINTNAKIIVPTDLYTQWIYATNWAKYVPNITSKGRIYLNDIGEAVVTVDEVWVHKYNISGWGGSNLYRAYYTVDGENKTEITHNNTLWTNIGFHDDYTSDSGEHYYGFYHTYGDSGYAYGEGTYEIWVEDGAGNKVYNRILEVR